MSEPRRALPAVLALLTARVRGTPGRTGAAAVRSRSRSTAIAALALAVASCGGSSPAGPNPLPSATPPVEVRDVVGVVFYDEDGAGGLDSSEKVRLGDVEVEVAGRRARSERTTGRVVVTGVPVGSATVSVRTETLPPYYTPRGPVSLTVPQAAGAELPIPVTLPIGNNRPNRYLAFGDSITEGDGSSDGSGYRDRLATDLLATLGAGAVVAEAYPGTRSNSGALRLPGALAARRPAYALILYGTNDWNDCRTEVPCFTVDSLRSMVQSARGAGSLPILATIIPANPDFPRQVPPERNQWIRQVDELIRAMASQEGVPLADLEAAFLAEPRLPDLFTDHVHPNDAGYAIIAREFFEAITSPRGSASGAAVESAFDAPLFGFVPPPDRPLARARLAPKRQSAGTER